MHYIVAADGGVKSSRAQNPFSPVGGHIGYFDHWFFFLFARVTSEAQFYSPQRFNALVSA